MSSVQVLNWISFVFRMFDSVVLSILFNLSSSTWLNVGVTPKSATLTPLGSHWCSFLSDIRERFSLASTANDKIWSMIVQMDCFSTPSVAAEWLNGPGNRIAIQRESRQNQIVKAIAVTWMGFTPASGSFLYHSHAWEWQNWMMGLQASGMQRGCEPKWMGCCTPDSTNRTDFIENKPKSNEIKRKSLKMRNAEV